MPLDLYLTEDRIRAVVRDAAHFFRKARSRRGRAMLSVPSVMPDFAAGETLINAMGDQFDSTMGPGAGQFMADHARLVWVLQVLERGSVEDAIAGRQRRWSQLETSGVDPEQLGEMRASSEIFAAQLRSTPQQEIDAVMACLDEIASLYPAAVHTIRLKHQPAERETALHAVTALRTGDPSRPELTAERIRRLLDVVSAIVPGPRKLTLALADGPYMLHGKSAAELFPVTTLKKIDAHGEDREVFTRDFVWMRLIAANLRAGETIDNRILGLIPRQDPAAWVIPAHPPARRRAWSERFAATMSRPLELLCLVGRDEEAAVGSLLDEIEERMRAAKNVQRESRSRSSKQG